MDGFTRRFPTSGSAVSLARGHPRAAHLQLPRPNLLSNSEPKRAFVVTAPALLAFAISLAPGVCCRRRLYPLHLDAVRIPMMPISHSDLMPIRSERSDAGLS